MVDARRRQGGPWDAKSENPNDGATVSAILEILDDPIVPTSLTDEIVVRLEKAILDGTYPAGTRLRQDELCTRFGVSRTPVREALRDLQARNLLVVIPNRGATVRVPSRRDARESYDVRAELEGYAAELAAGREGASVAARLGQTHELVTRLMRELHRSDGRSSTLEAQLHRANSEFHATIYTASGNKQLVATIRRLENSFPTEYLAVASRNDDAESEIVNVREHLAIMEALSKADRGSTRALMQDHLRHLGAMAVRFLSEQGFWTGSRGPEEEKGEST